MLNFRSASFAGLLALTLTLTIFSPLMGQEVVAEKKEWTFLIFLNADNNLEKYGYQDMQEMEKVGSNSDVNVLVQFDAFRKSGTPRYYVTKADRPHENSEHLQSKIVLDSAEKDMGDYREMVDFVEWGMKNYPAKHYMLLVWNHGSGWKKEEEPQIVRGISYDDTSNNHITTLQFAQAMKTIKEDTGNTIDMVTYDACLMAMAEIADTLTPYADYLVASEELVPGPGMPYDKFFEDFFKRESLSPQNLANSMVKEFGKSYSSGGSQGVQSVTMSAIDLRQFEYFKVRFNLWVETLETRSLLSVQEMRNAAKDAMIFGGVSGWDDQDYRDLGVYVRNLLDLRLAKEEGADEVRMAALRPGFIAASVGLLDAINAVVIENFRSKKYAGASGLAIYLPFADGNRKSVWNSGYSWDKKLKTDYLDLGWSKSTFWPAHLDQLFPNQ